MRVFEVTFMLVATDYEYIKIAVLNRKVHPDPARRPLQVSPNCHRMFAKVNENVAGRVHYSFCFQNIHASPYRGGPHLVAVKGNPPESGFIV